MCCGRSSPRLPPGVPTSTPPPGTRPLRSPTGPARPPTRGRSPSSSLDGTRRSHLRALPDELLQDADVHVLESLEPLAAPADVCLRQPISVRLREVAALVRRQDMGRDRRLVAGEADP